MAYLSSTPCNMKQLKEERMPFIVLVCEQKEVIEKASISQPPFSLLCPDQTCNRPKGRGLGSQRKSMKYTALARQSLVYHQNESNNVRINTWGFFNQVPSKNSSYHLLLKIINKPKHACAGWYGPCRTVWTSSTHSSCFSYYCDGIADITWGREGFYCLTVSEMSVHQGGEMSAQSRSP